AWPTASGESSGSSHKPTDPSRLPRIPRRGDGPTLHYLAGGATAVLLGWRPSTIDIDSKLEPELYHYPVIDPRRSAALWTRCSAPDEGSHPPGLPTAA
ncbi:MAG TPA: hypothetical protein VE685_15165, partial [Thermoanaerobaculia bacterium]|nr:hypothetical protein [Thermoanaerobaculia bacterium]